MRSPRARQFGRWCVTIALTWLLAAPAAALSAAGDGEQRWVALDAEGGDGVRLLHQQVDDPPAMMRQAVQLPGRLAPGAMAARGRSVWVLRADGTMQRISAQRVRVDGSWSYRITPGRRLPAGVTPRFFAIGPDAPWVLARVESAATLSALNQPPPEPGDADPDALDTPDALRNRALGLPPNYPREEADQPPGGQGDAEATDPASGESNNQSDNSNQSNHNEPEVVAARDAPEAVAADRLLYLKRGRWVSHPLPEGWPASGGGALLWPRTQATTPVLLRWPADGEGGRLWRWRDGEASGDHGGSGEEGVSAEAGSVERGWSGESIRGLPGSGRFAAAVVDRQIVVAASAEDEPRTLRLFLVRGGEATALAQIALDSPRPDAWRIAGSSRSLAVFRLTEARTAAQANGQDPEPPDEKTDRLGVLMTEVDLRGRVLHEDVALAVAPEPPLLSQPDQVVMTAVLIVATVLMLVFWRRDPKRNRLILPEGYRLAGMAKRALAGLIDLAPGLVVVLLVFGVEPMALGSQWPAQPRVGSWEAMFPGLTLIVVTVLHTMVGEALTGQSLGKKCTGLQVRSLTGRKATPMQVALRCVLKAFDLIAPLLLLLPVIGPFRQRLGDLVARTVVLMPTPPEEEQEQADDSDANGKQG